MLKIQEVNTLINSTHEYAPDVVDYWMTPQEFDEAGGGDCEDFAIAKYFALEDAIPDLWLAHVFIGNISHMVCLANGLVLDLHNEIKPLGQTGLVEVYRFRRDCLQVGDQIVPGPPNIKHWKQMLNRKNER